MLETTAPAMHQLPAIADDRLKPCAGCGGMLVPIFWIVRPVRCIIDERARRERAGLQIMLGSAQLASTFTSTPAAREFDHLPELCICENCACTRPLAEIALAVPHG